eukprot:scaffold17853_cov65-Cyclotella_meneghiniana.AAC.6
MPKHHHHKATPDRLRSTTPATRTYSSSRSSQIKKSFHAAAVTKKALRESLAEPNSRFYRVNKHQDLEEYDIPVLVLGTQDTVL